MWMKFSSASAFSLTPGIAVTFQRVDPETMHLLAQAMGPAEHNANIAAF